MLFITYLEYHFIYRQLQRTNSHPVGLFNHISSILKLSPLTGIDTAFLHKKI